MGMDKDIVFWDTETTGLGPRAEVIQIAGLVTNIDLVPKLVFNRYCWSNQEIEEGAERQHGITRELLLEYSGGRFFEEVLEEIKFFKDNPNMMFIAYKQHFDMGVVNGTLMNNGYLPVEFGTEIRTLKRNLPEGRYNLDAMTLFANVLNGGKIRSLGEMASLKLNATPDQLTEEYNEFCKLLPFSVPKKGLHDALYDSYLLRRMLNKFKALMYT
jgi:DNA polymerase III epsilon subunit-like protein